MKQYRSGVVDIGGVPLGGDYPVRLQSMTNTSTGHTAASVAQCIRIAEAGADYIRLSARDRAEAENLSNIKRELRRAGFNTPLIADIHFNPSVAITAARIVEKVRINPGNYADKRATFTGIDIGEAEYQGELERIHQRLLPLIEECRRCGTAIRVGVNHGSLSDRIMGRYGNTPMGMVVSAMEFIKIFAAENFDRLVISMKSSNIVVMNSATRMLASQMSAAGYNPPLHLGVTEAGEGEDGRIRSAMGIGSLLTDGIGDTIRVSLSEPPEAELPVAGLIVERSLLHLRGDGAPPGGAFVSGGRGNGVLHLKYECDDHDELAVIASVDAAPWLLVGSAGDLTISNRGALSKELLTSVESGILQAARIRMSRNDYISCPTCGRTTFDLPEAVARVKKATGHLTGLKIAVMGCVVNGPGEMADADYGYVGTASGTVHIYRRQEIVMRDVPAADAHIRLAELIESDMKMQGRV